MNESSVESSGNQSSWSPFMCPCCRGLFRSPSDRVGEAQCPLCQSAIQIPGDRGSTPPQGERTAKVASAETAPAQTAAPKMAAAAPIEEAPAEEAPRPERRRRNDVREPSWDQKESRSRKGGTSKKPIFISLFLLSILLSVAAFLFVQERDRRLSSFRKDGALTENGQNPNLPQDKSFFDFSTATQNPDKGPLLEVETADLDTARLAARVFLNSKTIEEFAPLIRDPERVMPLVREYHQRNPYQASGVRHVDGEGTAEVAKRFVSFNVVLRDYSSRPIALQLTRTKALVDWESWVGLCEMPWETFIEKQITDPTEVRVQIKSANYYNFSFRDDSKWACFRLATSIDGSVIYGYAPRSEAFFSKLPGPFDPEVTGILKIRYPDNAVSSNQVIITDFVQTGWVVGL